MLLIAVDGGGCHYRAIDLGKLSEQYKGGGAVLEAAHQAILENFKKLKWHKGKMDITITEVDDYVEQPKRTKESLPIIGKPRSTEVRLEESGTDVQTFKVSDKPRNKAV